MRQVFLDRGMVVVKEVSEPLLDDHSLLVAVRYSCMSSSADVHLRTQRNLLDNVPLKVKKLLESVATHGVDTTTALVKGKLQGDLQAFGSSCAGIVVAVGARVKKIQVGDLVACAGVGFAHHAEMVCVPEHLTVRVHNEASLRSASMAAIGVSALYGIHRAQIQLGEVVGVFGLDLVGQLIAQLAQRAGATVIACDVSAERRQIARKCGISHVIAPDHELTTRVGYLTQHYGLDTAYILGADTHEYVNDIALCTRRGGRVVLYSDFGNRAQYAIFYDKDIAVCSSTYGASWEQRVEYPYELMRWTERRHMQLFVDLVERGQLMLDPLMASIATLSSVDKVYDAVQKKEILSAIIEYPTQVEPLFIPAKVTSSVLPKVALEKFTLAKRNKVRVAIVGTSDVVRSRILPLISSADGVQVTAIADADAAKSLSVARQYNAIHAVTDEADIITNDLADLIVVASPHVQHTEHALQALAGGKAVFVEKPCVTTHQQLDDLMNFLYKNQTAPFCVDYSPSFSPFIQKIKKSVTKRSTPLVVNYRMNVGFMPQENWMQRDMSAGRIIGEACYVIDLFCYLTESMPTSVSVEAMYTDDPTLFPTDNFTAQIRFRDGSLCSLMYTSIGHAKLGKERMEIFFDSKSVVMDDFEYLAGNGFRRSFDETVTVPDRGQQALIAEFIDQLKANEYRPLIPLERLHTVGLLTLSIDKLACQGGGSQEFSL